MQTDVLADCEAPINGGVREFALYLYVFELCIMGILRSNEARELSRCYHQWFWCYY